MKYHCPKDRVFACGSFSNPFASQLFATVGKYFKSIRSKLNLTNIRELLAWSLPFPHRLTCLLIAKHLSLCYVIHVTAYPAARLSPGPID